MADPRYYRVELATADVTTARTVAARILRRCGEPPTEAAVEAWLSPQTITVVASALGGRGTVAVTVSGLPGQIGGLAGLVKHPRLDWDARQSPSRFGSVMSVAPPYRYEHEPLLTWLSLSFDGPTGRERDQQPRIEQWLTAMAEADLLPPQASPRRLADTFFTATALRPGQEPPRGRSTLACDGVRLRIPAYRADAGPTRHYGPCDIQVGVAVPAPTAFDRALALWRGDRTVEIHGYFDSDAAMAARWAEAGVGQFKLDLAEADAADVDMVLDAMTESDLAAIRWSCGWPGGGRYLNGLVLYANATGGPDDEPATAPGHATLHLNVSPRVNDRDPDSFAVDLADHAGVVLIPDPPPRGGGIR